MSHPRPGRYVLSIVAETGEQFADFQPYVGSINDEGVVAFQATLRAGGSGVYAGSGGSIDTAVGVTDGRLGAIVSHPAIGANGAICFYATTKAGRGGVFLLRAGELLTIADSHGPLGPTINEGGAIAYRATTPAGTSAIFKHVDGKTTLVAEATEPFSAFHGIPVINSANAVAFRADQAGEGQGIYLANDKGITPAAETGKRFRDLGHFPTLTDDGTVAFAAGLRRGGSGVFVSRNGMVETVFESARGPFRGFRGVLMSGSRPRIFYATPRDGRAGLGIFSGADPIADRLLAIGAPLLDSTVTDLSLNPVSINRHGQLAIRVRLENDRQVIMRADPGST